MANWKGTARRLLRFRLFSLLLLVTLCAIWLGIESHYAERQRRAAKALEMLELQVGYDYQKRSSGRYSDRLQPPGSERLKRFVGEDYFHTVEYVSNRRTRGKITTEAMVHLAALPHIEELWIADSKISDESLEHIEKLSKITQLALADCDITDAALKHLAGLNTLETLGLTENLIDGDGLKFLRGMTHLRELCLDENPLRDIGLSHIASMPNLEKLGLCDSLITDEGIKHLVSLPSLVYLTILDCEGISDSSIEYFAEMQSLKNLELYGTKLTRDGIDRLRKAVPNCQIDARRILMGPGNHHWSSEYK
ncbi:hypothetical protein OAS39_00030 [Pirellulales bacterium]|nr:hypothetical protein [Pirellulales bacterium]